MDNTALLNAWHTATLEYNKIIMQLSTAGLFFIVFLFAEHPDISDELLKAMVAFFIALIATFFLMNSRIARIEDDLYMQRTSGGNESIAASVLSVFQWIGFLMGFVFLCLGVVVA
ncbi:MAG: hypothetical protein RIR39_1322 [Pseudomonadota bacterium]